LYLKSVKIPSKTKSAWQLRSRPNFEEPRPPWKPIYRRELDLLGHIHLISSSSSKGEEEEGLAKKEKDEEEDLFLGYFSLSLSHMRRKEG
jgi:hypothetical protein